ncbi:chitin synthase regulatory factor [Scheffersomyces coipomensis]|uniref:chitin synthase regulatory factor n=1 Tax=Scheffersomyces coipomensis TaxID=1788519 RepID=UPI00315D8955
MSNPNHPYRQRVVSPPNSAPYPINEIDYNNNNNNGSNSAVNSNSTLPRHNGSSASLAPPLNNIAPNGPILKSPTINAINNPPYPYEAQTPPPVFAPTRDSNPHMVTSPQSIPLSATSSVTNLNLSHQAIYSKSENNLLTPPSKYIHSRSISSSSSFFYDRNDNASMIDFSQNIIQQHLGSNSTQLLPRIKTIELYRKNAKKSNDPTVLFQYAQYMLQTALLLDSESLNPQATATNANNSSSNASSFNTPTQSIENSPKKNSPFGKDHNGSLLSLPGQHKKSRSANSIDALGNEGNGEKMDDKKLKRSLLKEAVFYLRKLSDKGYVEAQYLLADAYSSGALGRIENREAFVLFQAAAKHSHIESAYRTSYCYEEGLGTGRDARKAVDYLKMAASKNHAAAMYKLGIYSFYGRMGLPHDIATKKLGIKWLERASNVANELTAAAPFELGKIFYNGFQDIVIPDQKYALELYSQAAALGHVEAAAILGQCYEHGEIVNQDNDLSIHYYTQAALGGDPESMLAMCAWYLVGSEPFLPKDDNEAFEWARRAALCNLPKAQFALANFYDKGIGCIKNSQEAQIWYKKAAENGEEKSISRISDKDTANKLQKQILKKKSSGKLFNGSGNNPNHSSSNSKNAAQDKDCVIM